MSSHTASTESISTAEISDIFYLAVLQRRGGGRSMLTPLFEYAFAVHWLIDESIISAFLTSKAMQY